MMYNSTCIYLVLVYILVKKFSSYIRCLLFICKLFKGLKMIKFIMSNLQREHRLFQQGAWHCNRNTSHFKMVAPGNSKVKNCLKKTSISELTTLGTTC